MQIQLSLHVFGSLKGYTTLAKTADVTSVETAFLERFSFGQTTDQSYLDSLDTNPAFISRSLPSGRWAITRVTKGPPDDYNRQTMLFTTAILTMTDWLDILHCNFMPLLQELRLIHFSQGEQLSQIVIDISVERQTPPAELREKIIPLLSAIETNESSGRNVILLNDTSYNADILSWLNMLLPRQNRAVFSCASRSLSDGLDVDVISMARSASFGNSTRRPIQFSPDRVTDKAPFTQMVDHHWQERGMPPWKFIDKCQSFTFDKNLSDFSAPAPPTIRPVRRPTVLKAMRQRVVPPLVIKIVLFFLIIAILATTGYFVKTRIKTTKAVSVLLVESKDFISKNGDLSAITQKFNGLIDDCRKLINRIDTLEASANDSRLIDAKKELESWLNKASERQMTSEDIKNLLADCERNRLEDLPSAYPNRQQVELVLDLKQRCVSCLKNAIEFKEDYKTQLGKFIYQISKWQNKTEDLLQDLRKSYEDIPKDILEKTPSAYDEPSVKDHNNIIEQLEKIKQRTSFSNALKSPIPEHQRIVKDLDANIDKNMKTASNNIGLMEQYRQNSFAKIDEVEKYLTDVNNIGADPCCIQRLDGKKEEIEIAKKYWAANPKIDEVGRKLSSAINISEAEKYLADMNSISTDPNYVQRLAKIEADVKDAERYWPTKVDEVRKKLSDARNFLQQIETIDKEINETEKHLADPNSRQILLDISKRINELKKSCPPTENRKNRFIELFKNWQKKLRDDGNNIESIESCRSPNPSDPNGDKLSYEDVGKILDCLNNPRKDNKENVQTDRDPNSASTN
jgi:hypothetical protein